MGQIFSATVRCPSSRPSPLHPSLIALAHATAHLQRAGRTEDALAWHSWATVIFDTTDHSLAFSNPQSLLPEHTSIPQDVQLAEKWLHIAGREFARTPIMDAQELFLVELGEYFERKHELLFDVLPGEVDDVDAKQLFEEQAQESWN